MLLWLCFLLSVLETNSIPLPQSQNLQDQAHPSSTSPSVLKDVRTPPNKNGEYSYEIILSDGSIFKESAILEEQPTVNSTLEDFHPSLLIAGEYSFKDPDGVDYHVTYTADKRGFRPIINIGGRNGSTLIINSNPPTSSGNATNEEPLHTISSSLFSSPSSV